MPALELTLARATKIWWSFLWRTWVLLIVPWLLLVATMFRTFSAYMTPPPRGATIVAHSAPHLPGWVMPVFLVVFFVIQILALRWALSVRWSDFRLQAVSNDGP